MVVTRSSCFVVVTRQKGIRVCVCVNSSGIFIARQTSTCSLFSTLKSGRPFSPPRHSHTQSQRQLPCLSLILTREHLCAQCTFLPLSLASSQ